VDPRSIDVSVDGQWLTIRAERSTKAETKDRQWLLRERSDASVVRRIALSLDVDVDHIEADYRDGVLSVVIPIAEDARPRRIPIGSGRPAAQQALGQGAPAAGGMDDQDMAGEAAQGKAEPAHSQVS
jgi:HSP20 family protein